MTTRTHAPNAVLHPVEKPGLFRYIALAVAAWRQRRALAQLDEARLRDIGLTLDEARREARRAIWDVPQHWLR